jgi:multidrug efflux pump subunit AcrA (membrane-fusion protein)
VGISKKSATSLKHPEGVSAQMEDLERREDRLHRGLSGPEAEFIYPDREELALRRENLNLRRELANLQQAFQAQQRRQEQLLALVERYRTVLQEFKGSMSPVDPGYPRED